MKPAYQCSRCKSVFRKETTGPTVCTKCDSVYVKWLNWEEMLLNAAQEFKNENSRD